jgi:50S ribosomal subunit-associated GTPase HflX
VCVLLHLCQADKDADDSNTDTTVNVAADGAGRHVMDLGHVVTALNKLDAADEEKILLSSRDGKRMFVVSVSYADVARCLDKSFNELCGGAVLPGALQY